MTDTDRCPTCQGTPAGTGRIITATGTRRCGDPRHPAPVAPRPLTARCQLHDTPYEPATRLAVLDVATEEGNRSRELFVCDACAERYAARAPDAEPLGLTIPELRQVAETASATFAEEADAERIVAAVNATSAYDAPYRALAKSRAEVTRLRRVLEDIAAPGFDRSEAHIHARQALERDS